MSRGFRWRLAAACVVTCAATTASADAATRYASPIGSGDCTTVLTPCSLSTAVTAATAGDTVLLAAGDYGSSDARLGGLINDRQLTIRGAGSRRTKLWMSAAFQVRAASTVSDLAIDTTAPGFSFNLFGGGGQVARAERVHVVSSRTADRTRGVCGIGNDSDDGSSSAFPGGVIVDSVCAAPNGGAGVWAYNAVRADLINVTAVGSGTSETLDNGLIIEPRYMGPTLAVTVTNSLLIGNRGIYGVNGAVSPGTIAVDHSYYGTAETPSMPFTQGAGNFTTAPTFAGAGDYRQPSFSSGIDAGVDTTSTEDVAGNRRKTGSAVDAGALERPPIAALTNVTATDVTSSSAQLNGTVNPNGGQTDAHFEYGPTPGLGSSGPTLSLRGNDPATPATLALTGLQPAKTYYWRLEATTDLGTAVASRSFTTPPGDAVATTGAATNIAITTATVNGTVDTGGVAGTAHFELTPAGGGATIVTPDQALAAAAGSRALTADVTGLAANTAYDVVVVLTTDAPDSASSTAVPFTTLFALPTITAPTSSDVGPTTAKVTTTVDTFGDTATVHFVVTPEGGGAFITPSQALPAASGPRAVTADLSGLSPNTNHSVVAVLETGTGRTETTAAGTFKTQFAPPVMTTGAASDVTQTGAKVSGTVDLEGDTGTAHFVVTPAGGTPFTTPDQTLTASFDPQTVTATLTGLKAGTAYTYKLVVKTGLGRDAEGEAKSLTTVARPSALKPSLKLTVSGGKAGQLLLNRRTISLYVTCGNLACTATAKGTVKFRGKTYGRLSAPKKPLSVAANQVRVLKVTSTAKLRRSLRRAMAKYPKSRATITLVGTFTGADGKKSTQTLTVRVRKLK